jgi:hypothetical protein
MTYTKTKPTPQRPIGSGFGAETTAAEVIRGIDLSRQTAIVTGVYSGIGLQTTKSYSEKESTATLEEYSAPPTSI